MSDLEDEHNQPDSEGSGDEIRPYGDPDNSDEEEEEEEEGIEEMNEEDKRFIVDEDEDEDDPADDEDGPVVKKRKKKKRKAVDEEEDFDDDLELVAENTGQVYQRENKFKRLKQGRVEEARVERNDDLERMFDDGEAAGAADFQEDDLNDFIEDDDDDDIEAQITAPATIPRPARQRNEERDAGIHDEAYDEVFDIFGGGEDYSYALLRPEEMQQDITETKLEDVFEPSELVERMLTERDEQIRITDLPERFQLQLGPDADPRLSDDDIEAEIVWMAPHILKITGQRDTSEPLYDALRHILRFMTQENLEIPYIRMHCQDYYTEHHRSGSRHNTFTIAGQDLWEVHDLHFQWRSVHDRQEALRALYTKLDIEDAYFNDQMARADKMDDLEDLTEYLQMQYADQILRAKKEIGYKRPTKVSNFEAIKKTPIYEFTKKFGLSVKDFGTNLLQGNRIFFTEDDGIPEDVAATYVSSQFPTPEMVLRIAKSAVAQEIGCDPQMRKAFRIVYEHKATISVFPTEKGKTRIDAHHPYYAFKYLNNKPITAFHDGQFLEILNAEAEGLTHVRVLHQNEDKFVDIMHKLYLSDAYSASAEQWNEIRRDVLNTALTEYLRPMAEKWVKEKLRKEAEKRIAREIQLNLETKLNIAPFRSQHMEPDSIPRVLAITWGNGEFAKDAVNMVLMDTDGRVRDTLKVNTLRDPECLEMFASFVDEWKPDVIGIAGLHSISTRRLHEQVERVCTEARSSGNMNCEPTIMIVNDEVARLYYNSKRAVEEFRQFSPLMRYAIALARRLQSPVHEYAALGKDIIHIRHHRLQNLLREDTLVTFTERALINIINQLGVDINEVIVNPYKAHALQYVCGLGLRKAQGFLKRINATGEPLESRAELITRKIATKCIFLNCASFLKIRPYVEVLDDTRIHPQDYQLARKMAADALDMEDEDISQYDTPSQLVLDLIKNDEDKLDVLDLDEYADTLEAQIRTPKRMTLLHIKHELQAPYKDTRYPYPYPTADESFALITGETDRTFRPGAIIPVVITKLRDRSASARLDNGLDGIITIQNMADHRINNPSEVLQVGTTVRCQIVAIDKVKFLVDLSCLPSMVQAGDTATMTQRDQYFDDYEEEQDKNTEINKKKSRERSTRVIQHPAFRPMNGKEAELYLAGRPRGEFVVRPSSRGNDHIAVTWKVDEGIYQHIDVVELEKENEFALGKILRVGQATYDDLDELIALHVENMSRKVEEMMVHPKFRKGDIRDMYEFLAATSMANPRLAVYSFCLNPEHPGTFNLAFKINAQNEPKKWVVRVTPNSYKLGDHDYPDVNSLINGFKKLQMAGAQRKPQGSTTTSSAPKPLPPHNQPQPPPPKQFYQPYPHPQYQQPDASKPTTIPPWRR